MMTPVGRLVLLRSIDKSALVNAMAWVTIPALIGPVIGPPLGGFITTYFSWRWIFYVNVPIGALGIILTWKFITNVMEADTPPLDKTGFALSGLGLSSFVFGLAVLGENTGSLGFGFLLTAAGLAICALYVWHARRTENPVIDLALLCHDEAEAVVRLGVVRIQLECMAVGSDRLVRFPLRLERIAQVVVGLDKVRFQVQCPAVGGDRLVQLSLGLECIAQIAVEGRFGPIQFDCPIDVDDGNLVLTHLEGNESQQMQCVGLIRIDCEDLPVNLLGSLKSPRLMMLDGHLKGFGNRCHSEYFWEAKLPQLMPKWIDRARHTSAATYCDRPPRRCLQNEARPLTVISPAAHAMRPAVY
jgi:hypothetical protein